MRPNTDGPTLCRRIRERTGVAYTYEILLTSRAERIEKPLGYGEMFAHLEIAQRLLPVQAELHHRTLLTEELNRPWAINCGS